MSALKSAPSDLQFDNVGREAEGVKFVKVPQSDITLGQKANDPVKVDGDADLWIIPEEVEARTKGRFLAKPVRLLMGKHFGQNRGFGLAHIEAGHAKEIAATGMTTEQWVVSVIKSATKIVDNGSGRLIVYSAKAPKGTAFIELRNDGDFYSVVTAYHTEPKGKIVWSGRRHLISSEGSNVSGTQGTVATTTGLPINPTVRTDTIADKSSAQSRETLTDQTTDENIAQNNEGNNNIKFSRSTPANTASDNDSLKSIFRKVADNPSLSWLGGLFTRNQLVDLMTKYVPEMINYKLLSSCNEFFQPRIRCSLIFCL